jgi:hypothetical protein
MEYNTNKLGDLNWNAGTEFNKIIGEIKLKYIQAVLIRDFESCLELLSMDLDFAYAKIFEESKKRKENDDIERIRIKLEDELKEIRNYIKQKKVSENHNSYKSYEYDVKDKLENVRHEIWQIQGKYGVLYPQIEKKIRDKGRSLRDGFIT